MAVHKIKLQIERIVAFVQENNTIYIIIRFANW